MSSSRSIAAARNRRSGDSASGSAPTSRPNRSIGAQSSFAPPQQQIKRPGQQSQPMQQNQNPYNNQSHGDQGLVPITKLSVSDAIGLVTLRLGRLETFMYDVQAGVLGTTGELPENTQLVDKSVMTSIINRVESLEKKEPTVVQNSNANAINNNLLTQLNTLEKEIKDIKEILLNHMLKYEKFTINNEQRFEHVEETIHSIDDYLKNEKQAFDENENENVELFVETVNDESSVEDENNEEVVASIDLKQAIQKELANNNF
jgi:hypothetical protein